MTLEQPINPQQDKGTNQGTDEPCAVDPLDTSQERYTDAGAHNVFDVRKAWYHWRAHPNHP